MSVTTNTGTLFAIVAATPTAETDTAYGALSWTNVAEITDLPEYGPDITVVNYEALATGITKKLKGFINYGSLSIGLGRDPSDDGQAILKEGVDGSGKDQEHSVRVTFPDGTIHYYMINVFSYTTNTGSANSVIASTVKVEINSMILEV